jgi:diguanylate cyclase (GGDEF)-like protein
MGSFRLKLVGWFALLALLPLAVAFSGYDTLARRSEVRRADAALESGLRAAVAAYAARLDAASANARRLAAEPAVQRALRAHDRAALRRLVPAPPSGPAAARTVTVVDRGRVLGRVSVFVRVDDPLLRTLGSALRPGDHLVALRRGRVLAGAHRGAAVTLVPGSAEALTVDGHRYRALVTSPLHEPPGLAFAALTRSSAISAATRAADRRVAAALVASLVLFAAATYLLGRSIVRTLRRLASAADALAGGRLNERVETRGNDEFAQLGRAFNRMAAQLEQRLEELETERLRVREANARFGDALAATLDPAQLVQIVVESAAEATGATGGVVIGPDGEAARAGDPDAGGERIALPLRIGSSDFGMLVLSGDAFEADDIETATALTAQIAIALENARLHRIVQRQALLDSLTGLANRRSLEETLRTELARAARFGNGACLVLADLDDFKLVNDRYGHAAGDEVLKVFADALRETVRESDAAGRWGGEEFALVLSGTDAAGGARLAERARAAIAGQRIPVGDAAEVTVTASFGVAAFPECGDPTTLLHAADDALYEAKRQGKNRVVEAPGSTAGHMV